MKIMLALVLILLLLVVGFPVAMGHMGHMGDCPACTSAKAPFALGLCAGILSLMGLAILLASRRFRLSGASSRQFLLASSIFRPPRAV
jgi:hypothetical protein